MGRVERRVDWERAEERGCRVGELLPVPLEERRHILEEEDVSMYGI